MLDRYGRNLSLPELSNALGPAAGVTAEDFAAVARDEGLEATIRELPPAQLDSLQSPAIVQMQRPGWAVMLGQGARTVTVANPLRGVQKMDRKKFERLATGTAIELSPRPDIVAQKRPGPIRSILAILPRSVVRGQIWVILLSLVAVIPVIVVPLLLRSFVDLFLVAGISAASLQVLVGVLLMAGLQFATLLLQNVALARGGAAVDVTTTLTMLRGILNAPQRFLQERSAYDLAGRTSEIQVLGQLVAGQMARGIAGGLVFIAATVVMIVLSPVLALVSTGLLLLGMQVNRMLAQKALLSSQQGSIERRELRAEAGQVADNFETLKSLGYVHALFDRFGDKLAAVKTTGVNDDVEWQRPVTGWLVVSLGTRLAILIVGAQLVIFDQISLGTLVAVQALVGSQISPLLDLVQAQESVIRARSAVVALEDVTSQQSINRGDTAHGQESGEVTADVAHLPAALPKPTVKISGLSFGYRPRRPLTIDDISVDIDAGHRVAIVGPSGSGKSTIARIVVGLMDPWAGAVDLGELPRGQWPTAVTSSTLGYVSQDVTLFEGTVRDNVTMLDPRLHDEQVTRALEDAQLLAEIERRPGGLDHRVRDRGVGFSGGQIQRLGIARALVRDPRVLVMDEATSALEPTTEFRVDQAVRRRGCTTVVIAHRLSTVRDADVILVVDGGTIVEQGTHDQLLALDGLYRRLVVG